MVDTIKIFGAVIFPLFLHYYIQQRKNEKPVRLLNARELQNSYAMSISEELSDKIRDRFGDLKLINLFVLKIKIENLGAPVKHTDLMEPIELSFDNEFLECICIENPKGVNVVLNSSVNCRKEYCRFNLMDTGDWFTLQFVSLQKLSTPIVNSKFAGSPKVNIISSSGRGKIFSSESRGKVFSSESRRKIFSSENRGKTLSSAQDRSLSSGRSRAFPKVSTNKQSIKEIGILITVVMTLVYFYLL